MTKLSVIFKRELASYFATPLGEVPILFHDAREDHPRVVAWILNQIACIYRIETALRERNQALEKAQRMLAAGKPAEEVTVWLANTLTNRLLHAPTSHLRQAATEGHAELIQAARKLYGLDEKDDH